MRHAKKKSKRKHKQKNEGKPDIIKQRHWLETKEKRQRTKY